MKSVSRFEANLLRILHCILQRVPLEPVLPLITGACRRPPCLSRAAVELVQDALSKGCLMLLARGGGWQRARHLRGERVVEGRLWERTPPEELGLSFSRHALEFLLWITGRPPGDPMAVWQHRGDGLTTGDRLLLLFAYEVLRETQVGAVLRGMVPFGGDGLCRLAFPEDFADPPAIATADFSPWVTEPGTYILEALQPRLAERWLQVERYKARIGDARRMRALGQSQEQVLRSFTEAVEGAGRRDLARFLLQAAAVLLQDGGSAWSRVAELDVRQLRLADRTEMYRAALALPRHLERLRQWDLQARTVGYFDDGYAASQLWKADWEQWQGEALWARAQALVRELEPLPT